MLKSFSFGGSYRKLDGIEGFSGIRDHEAEKGRIHEKANDKMQVNRNPQRHYIIKAFL